MLIKKILSDVLKEKLLNCSYLFDVIVTNVELSSTKNNQTYLKLNLVAGQDGVEARKWDSGSNDLELFKQGNLVTVTGKFKMFRDKVQFNIDSAKVLKNPELWKTLLPTAPLHNQLHQELLNFFHKITDLDYKKILEVIFDAETLNNFFTNRAAIKYHHTVYGGLLWHTVTMLRAAEKLVAIYDYLPINHSLLYAGIILHDIGKIIEIGDYFQNKYSFTGQLIGHISIGADLVVKIGTKLAIGQKKIDLLQHLILSSHGKLEHGSPVEPRLVEAVLLSRLDDLDAKMGMIFNAIQSADLTQSNNFDIKLNERKITFWLHHFEKK